MKITNANNLPQSLVDVMEKLSGNHAPVAGNEITATQLLKGTCELLLSQRHGNEAEIDVSDAFVTCDGTAIHKMLEDASKDGITEKTLKMSLETIDHKLDGIILTGTPDLYLPEEGIIVDYKNTKVATYQQNLEGGNDEWMLQLYTYYRLLLANGEKPKKALIVAMLKDHSKIKATTDISYPQHAVMTITYDFSSRSVELDNEWKEFVYKKVMAWVMESIYKDEELTPCSPKERFENEKWQIAKIGNIRATKNFDSEDEANSAFDIGNYDASKFEIRHKGGTPMKCILYCSYNKWCPFYTNYLKNSKEALNETTQG